MNFNFLNRIPDFKVKTKVIIISEASTFSFWLGYFSDAVVIRHHAHIYASLPPALK